MTIPKHSRDKTIVDIDIMETEQVGLCISESRVCTKKLGKTAGKSVGAITTRDRKSVIMQQLGELHIPSGQSSICN